MIYGLFRHSTSTSGHTAFKVRMSH